MLVRFAVALLAALSVPFVLAVPAEAGPYAPTHGAAARIRTVPRRVAVVTQTVRPARAAQGPQVWVNLKSGIYHLPGTRWYGRNRDGEFMSEADARAHGYRVSRNKQ